MTATRRPAEESRALLIQAAAEIINTEGYAALSARVLAEKVGLKRQIVHYYFRTMDDLLLAVVRHYGEEGLARLGQAIRTRNPLRAIWEEEPDASATTYAFLAMSKHLPRIRAEIELYFKKYRDLKIEAVAGYLAEQVGPSDLCPAAIVNIIQSIAQGLKAETQLGADSGHAETKAIVERWLSDLGTLSQCLSPKA